MSTIRSLLSVLVVLCCATTSLAADKPTVFVSIAPQRFFVQRIATEMVRVEVLVPPGASPHTYEPKPSQMKALASAAAFFAIGVNFEDVWLERIAALNRQLRIVHTDAGIAKLAMADHHDDDQHDEPAGAEHNHDHEGGLDPHIWLAPSLVRQQAQTIAAALEELLPGQATLLQHNLAGLLADIDGVDQRLKSTLAGKAGMEFMVFHPSWGYFAADYGLTQVAIEVSGKAPKPGQLKELIEHARERGIRMVFAQPQLSSKSADLIAREIGGQVVMIDPLAEDWLANMTVVADRMRDGLR